MNEERIYQQPKQRRLPLSAGDSRPVLTRQAAGRKVIGWQGKISLRSLGSRYGRMTQRELADECGINFRVVHDVIVGLNRKEATIRLISERLGLPS